MVKEPSLGGKERYQVPKHYSIGMGLTRPLRDRGSKEARLPFVE